MLQTSQSWSYTGATWFISGQGRSHNPCNIHAEHSRACAIADVSKIHYKIRKIPPDPPLPTESPHNDCSVKGTVCRPETTVGRIFATSAVNALIFKKGRARTISKMSIRATAFFCTLGFLTLFLSANADTGKDSDSWLPIKIEHGKLLVPSRIAGIDGYSMIDSGANFSAVNANFLQNNAIALKSFGQVQVKGIAERKQRRHYRNVPVTLLGVDTEFSDLIEVSLGNRDIQFILGADFLGLAIFQFDYPNERMRLLNRERVNLGKLSNVTSRVDRTGCEVIAKVRLNDAQNVWLSVDTGASSGVLMERSIVAQHDWLTSYPSELLNVRGVNAGSTVEQFRLPVLQIGNFEVTDVPVRVPAKGNNLELFDRPTRTDSNLRCRRGKAQGLLGYEVLKDFVLTIDYRKGKIHLQPTTTS